jgi:hypothetical protein
MKWLSLLVLAAFTSLLLIVVVTGMMELGETTSDESRSATEEGPYTETERSLQERREKHAVLYRHRIHEAGGAALVVTAFLVPVGIISMALALGWKSVRRRALAVTISVTSVIGLIVVALLASFTGHLISGYGTTAMGAASSSRATLLRFTFLHGLLGALLLILTVLLWVIALRLFRRSASNVTGVHPADTVPRGSGP